jgi:hypothetical protein
MGGKEVLNDLRAYMSGGCSNDDHLFSFLDVGLEVGMVQFWA